MIAHGEAQGKGPAPAFEFTAWFKPVQLEDCNTSGAQKMKASLILLTFRSRCLKLHYATDGRAATTVS
jgi:hypothetical protein